jgi:hypothetical protein
MKGQHSLDNIIRILGHQDGPSNAPLTLKQIAAKLILCFLAISMRYHPQLKKHTGEHYSRE